MPCPSWDVLWVIDVSISVIDLFWNQSVCVCVAFLPNGKGDKNKSKTKN